MPYDPKAALLASIERAQAQSRAGAPLNIDPSAYTPAPVDFAPVRPKPAQVVQSTPQPLAPQVAQAPSKNFLQSIADPFADFAATGIRAAQGVGRGVQALGQSAIGDKEAAAETMRKINQDIYKPVNIPLLGQGDVRRLGDVTEKGTIAPSKETLKTLGTGLELASFAAPVKGGKALTSTVGNQVFKKTGKAGLAKAAGTVAKYTLPSALGGALAGGGSKLAETGDLGEAGKSALGGAAFGGIVGTALPKIAGALSKKATPSLAEAAKINRQALAIGTKEAKKELTAGLRGQTRNMPLELAKEGIVFKTKEEAGRKIFDVADSMVKLGEKMDVIDTQLDNLIASQPSRRFNLNYIKNEALKRIGELTDVTDSARAKLKKDVLSEFDAMIEAQAGAVGKKGAFAINGQQAQTYKKAFQKQAKDLYEAKARGAIVSDADRAAEAIARAFRENIEKQYAGAGDVSKLNKELGRLAEINKFVKDYEGRIVKGGYLGRKLGGMAGVVASQAIPAPPVIREMVGYKVGEKLSDFIDDPTRKMLKAAQKANPEQKAQGAVGKAVGGLMDKIPEYNVGAVATLGADSFGGSPEAQSVPQETPQTGKYTPAQIGQRMKAKHPELANFSDEEIGSRMIAKHPELAQIAQ